MIQEITSTFDQYMRYLSNGKYRRERDTERRVRKKWTPPKPPHECPICGRLTTKVKYCGEECRREGTRLYERERRARMKEARP